MKTVSVILVHTGGSHIMTILDSINHTKYDRELIEVLVVENIKNSDNSENSNYSIKELKENNQEHFEKFKFTIKLLKVNSEFENNNILFNIGVKYSEGSILLFNDTEIVHVGDVISAAVKFVDNTNYVTFPVLKLPTEPLNPILETYLGKVHNKMDEVPELHFGSKEALTQIHTVYPTNNFWSVHPTHNPTNYYYLSAIAKETLMNRLNGGFNEDFVNGHEYHDKEFIDRVYKANISVYSIMPGKLFPMGIKFKESQKEFNKELIEKNKKMFDYYEHISRLNHPFKIIQETQ